MQHFEDLRRGLFTGLVHEFSAYRGALTFGNGSRIIAGHFQADKDIDAYVGLEYDAIGIEEATTLSSRKHQDILPNIEAELAPAHLFNDESRRDWACVVSDQVPGSVFGKEGNGNAVCAGTCK